MADSIRVQLTSSWGDPGQTFADFLSRMEQDHGRAQTSKKEADTVEQALHVHMLCHQLGLGEPSASRSFHDWFERGQVALVGLLPHFSDEAIELALSLKLASFVLEDSGTLQVSRAYQDTVSCAASQVLLDKQPSPLGYVYGLRQAILLSDNVFSVGNRLCLMPELLYA